MMKKKPVLVIMAAGMGSRYGGLKQIDPIDDQGNLIIDFSIYDAVAAGFEKVIFLIKKSIEKDFKDHIGRRMEKHVETAYVYQELDRLPEGYECPAGRVKPWGTVRIIREYFIELDCTVPVRSGGGLEHSECAAG